MSGSVERFLMWSFFAWLFKRAVAPKRPAVDWSGVWFWPVPTLRPPMTGVYEAEVSSGFESSRRNKDGTKRQHRGLDIMYHRRNPKDMPEILPKVVDPRDDFASTKTYFAPVGTPIVAARKGKVWSVKKRTDGGGWSVVIDHGAPWATYYTHLVEVEVMPKDEVAAGQPIGVMGGNLADSERVRHLHFECWYQGYGSANSEDAKAAGVMGSWKRAPWSPTRWP